MDRSYNERSFNNDRSFNEGAPVRPWVAMARASATNNGKSHGMPGADARARSGHGSSSSGDENVNGKVTGSGAKSWCNALCNGVMPNEGNEQRPMARVVDLQEVSPVVWLQ
ncbi:MAG: hypothetical protein HC767_01230 [Akkermansiaceae bacterium]|nr:hypothetical protein [Akkermansiaceae bacterium]